MKTYKAPQDIYAGNALSIKKEFKMITKNYPQEKYHLDLSDVTFMDSFGCRVIFDYWSKFPKITPPKSEHVIELYDTWLDSKKGLSK